MIIGYSHTFQAVNLTASDVSGNADIVSTSGISKAAGLANEALV
jgi:hypothetical protein